MKVSAGSYDLNKWLHGGWESGIISVIYGGPGSGKTNFCLLAAVSQAKRGKKVLFVDTEGGFSVERVRQVVGEDSKGVLENIILLKPVNFKEQKKAFVELRNKLKEHVSLIIVDGMTMLYRLDFAEARDSESLKEMQKVNFELVEQVRTLAEIARRKDIPIIVTNQVYSWDKVSKMVGGDILKYWGKCLIELTNEAGRRSVHIRKHRSLKEKSLPFIIDDKGVKKRGWL